LDKFHSGIALASIGEKHLYIDILGNVIFDKKLGFYLPFWREFLQIWLEHDRYGIINRRGEMVIPMEFERIDTISNRQISSEFESQTLFACKNGGQIRLFDERGGEIFTLECDEIESFTNGIAKFRRGEHYGFVRLDGSLLCDATFEDAMPWTIDGRSLVKIAGKWGIMNSDGTMALPAIYDALGGTSAPIPAKMGALWGYLGADGWIIEPTFDDAERFWYGFANVSQRGRYGIIDERGNWVIAPRFGAGQVDAYEDFIKFSIPSARNARYRTVYRLTHDGYLTFTDGNCEKIGTGEDDDISIYAPSELFEVIE